MQKFQYKSGLLNAGLNNYNDDMLIDKNQLSDGQNIIWGITENDYAQKRPAAFTPTDPNSFWRTGYANYGQAKKIFVYNQNSGAQFWIAWTGHYILYTANLGTAWTPINPLNIDNTAGFTFNSNYTMQFTVFQDMLIATNGQDDAVYWDGSMPQMLRIDEIGLTIGNGGSVNTGKHSFMLTYEIDGKPNVIYQYYFTPSITVTSGKTIEISNIPLGPTNAYHRILWATLAGGSAYYNILGNLTGNNIPYLDNDITSYTFNITDTNLQGFYPFNTYKNQTVSGGTKWGYNITPVPKAPYCLVFEDRLFFIGINSSEIAWTDTDDFEDFLPLNVLPIEVNDGDFITGASVYEAMGQLIVFKKENGYIVYSSSDTYAYRNFSDEGCSYNGSIQNFHINDEHGERDILLWANKTGIWGWDGSTIRLHSKEITKLWKNIQQRNEEFMKYTLFSSEDLPITTTTAPGANNYIENANGGGLDLQNQFQWFRITALEDAQAWCFANGNLYYINNSGYLCYLVWNTTYRIWTTPTQISLDNTAYTVHKMQYFNDGRLYIIAEDGNGGGYIYRTPVLSTWSGTQNTFTNYKTFHAYIYNQSTTYTFDYESQNNSYLFCIGYLYVPNDQFVPYYSHYGMRWVSALDGESGLCNWSSAYPSGNFLNGGSSLYLKKGAYWIQDKLLGVSNFEKIDSNYGYDVFPGKGEYHISYSGNIEMAISQGYLFFVDYQQNQPNHNIKFINLSTWVSDNGTSGITNYQIGGHNEYTLGDYTSLNEYYYNVTRPYDISCSPPPSWTTYTLGMMQGGTTGRNGIIILSQNYVNHPFNFSGMGNQDPDIQTQIMGYFGGNTTLRPAIYNSIYYDISECRIYSEQYGPIAFGQITQIPYSGNGNTETVYPFIFNQSGNGNPGMSFGNPVTMYNDGLNRVQCLVNQSFPIGYYFDSSYELIEYDLTEIPKRLATVTNNPSGISTINVDNSSMLQVGENIDIYIGNTHYALNAQIIAINSNTQITLNVVVSIPQAGAYIYLAGEYVNKGNVIYNLGLPSSDQLTANGIKSAYLVSGMNNGAPDHVIVNYSSMGGDQVWMRGVIGNYTISGNWILTGSSGFNIGANGITSQICESVVYNSTLTTEDETLGIYAIASASNQTSFSVSDFLTNSVNPNGSTAPVLPGSSNNYFNFYITMSVNVGSIQVNSANWQTPYLENIILSWINFISNTTQATTEIASIAYDNFYYLSACEIIPSKITQSQYNNIIFVLDMRGRWIPWRNVWASNFAVCNENVYWTDCSLGTSDFIIQLFDDTSITPKDNLITSVGGNLIPVPTPIDAWIVTKNFSSFAQYDDDSKKKIFRHMYITGHLTSTISPAIYSLEVDYNIEENTDASGNTVWIPLTGGYSNDETPENPVSKAAAAATAATYTNEATIALAAGNIILAAADFAAAAKALASANLIIAPSTDGKFNFRLDFPKNIVGKRIRFRFRNNGTSIDMPIIEFILLGQILHQRN